MTASNFSRPLEHGPTLPWWRVGMVWLALSGPAVVVVAGIVTMVIAVRGADPVLRPRVAVPTDAAAPALQARNHAATVPRGGGK